MPDEIMMAIATTIAAKATEVLATAGHSAVARLVALVRNKVGGDRAASEALDTASTAPSDDVRVRTLCEALERLVRTDPAFAGSLRDLWGQASTELSAAHDGVVNQVSGTVTGPVVQARDIHGGITFG